MLNYADVEARNPTTCFKTVTALNIGILFYIFFVEWLPDISC